MTRDNAPSKDALAANSNAAIEAAKQELFDLSVDVHDHPELNYQEFYSSAALAGFLEKHNLHVERGIGGVETAFRATIPGGGGDGPTIAVLAEYDALPEIGHGCGHNLIAMAAMGAGLGLQANAAGLPGRIMVIGTPAEEGGGGKIRLLEAGVFDGVDVTLSSHPFSNRTIIPTEAATGESWSLAMVGYRYMYHGKAAHAAAAPGSGHQRPERRHPPVHRHRRHAPAPAGRRPDSWSHNRWRLGAKRRPGVRRRQLHAALPRPPLLERRCSGQGKGYCGRSGVHDRRPAGGAGILSLL